MKRTVQLMPPALLVFFVILPMLFVLPLTTLGVVGLLIAHNAGVTMFGPESVDAVLSTGQQAVATGLVLFTLAALLVDHYRLLTKRLPKWIHWLRSAGWIRS